MEQARKQADQNYESYCNGHIAVQMLANLNESVFAQQYLGNLLAPPDASRRPAPVHARYGRRYDEAIWPERREDVSVIMDLTALLTVHGLGLLDIVERAFGRILLAPDAVNVLTHIGQKTTPLQPDRLEAARHLVELAVQGALPDPATVSPVDTFRVVWEVADGEPESTLNLPALIAAMQAAWDAAQLADITDRLDETVKVAPVGPRPKAGATVILDAGIAVELHLVGALDAVRGHYTLCVTGEEIDQRRFEILQAERDERLAAALDTLIERIAAGAKDGTYEFVPFDPKAPAEPVSRQYFQCLRAMETQGSLFWVDDRFTTSVDTPAYPTVTTVEILEALGRYGRLDAGRITQARLHLRAAGWTFMPVDGPEIASLVLACVRGGEVSESEDLRTLRRSTAWSVLERRRLQWPSGEQADQGVRGEIPFLLDQGSAVVAALISIWSDKKVSNDDASAASSWILEHLDMSGRPPTVIPAGDPRSDFLAGLHIGHLVALAMQVTPLRRNADRKKAYLEWLWGDVIGNRLRSCPEMLPTVLETIERMLLEDVLEDPDQQRIWNAFSFEVVDALPDELRNRLLDRPAMTAAYNVQRTGTMAAAGGEFDARAYLATIIALQPGKDSRLKTVDGRKAKFRLTGNGEESAVTVTIGRRSARVDDWPRRMSSDDAVVRRAALEEQAMALDMGPSERDALNDELAAISGAERPLKVVFLAGDTMSGWFGQLEGKLRARKPIGPAEILPDDIAPAFLRLQLDGTRSLADAQALPDLAQLQPIQGIVYLHGRLNQAAGGRAGYVITSADFGRAYLAEGWAARFVRALSERYTIVLLGYSANDPPMRYLLEGLNSRDDPARRTLIYAFTPQGAASDNEAWRDKGVTPIAYQPGDAAHNGLWDSLFAWADAARDPDSWRAKLVTLAQRQPADLKPFEGGQVAHLVGTRAGAGAFASAEPKPPAEWLCVFDAASRYAKPGRLSGFDRTEVDPLDMFGLDNDPPRPAPRPGGGVEIPGEDMLAWRHGDEQWPEHQRLKKQSEEGKGYAKRFPAEALALLNALVGEDRQSLPWNLRELLELIAEAAPALRQSDPWRRLKVLVQ